MFPPSSTVYDVSLADKSWPMDSFDVVSGNFSRTWESLDAWVIIYGFLLLYVRCLIMSLLTFISYILLFTVELLFLTQLSWSHEWKAHFRVPQLWLHFASPTLLHLWYAFFNMLRFLPFFPLIAVLWSGVDKIIILFRLHTLLLFFR